MRIVLVLIAVCSGFLTYGQSPEMFNYQAVLRNTDGDVRINEDVQISISILQDSPAGTVVYNEIHSVVTNQLGLINLQVGNGSGKTGSIGQIQWGGGSHFINVRVDGIDFGTSQLLSVPYSLHAKAAENVFSGDYNDLNNIPGIVDSSRYSETAGNVFSGDYLDLKNQLTFIDSATSSLGVGTRYLETSTGNQNIGIGLGALRSNTLGYSNVAVGTNVLGNTTTGNFNTGVGDSVLVANTTGFYNTAIGFRSLYTNTEGFSNTAIGEYALYRNTTGDYNTASGSGALYQNTTGNFNTSLGTSSLQNNTTGNGNTAVGSFALRKNETGAGNTAIGRGALYENLADNNTATGFLSLHLNTTGAANTAMGFQALNSNIGGGDNAAIGVSSLYANETGLRNIALGNEAVGANVSGNNNTGIGFNSLLNTTGSNNTGIGKDALKSNTTGSGNTAIGLGADVSAGNLQNATAIGQFSIVDASDKVRIGNASVTVVETPVPVTVASDRRLKKDIHTSDLGLDFIMKLNPVQYTMKAGNGQVDYGFIAQELSKILDEEQVNMINKDGNFYTVRYNDLIAPLVKAVQEQNKLIIELQRENMQLKRDHGRRLDRLEAALGLSASN